MAEAFARIVLDCKKRRSLAYARRTYLDICLNGMDGTTVIGNYLVPMFVDCGSLQDAERAFIKLLDQNEITWTSLIQGFTVSGKIMQAFDLFYNMKDNSVRASTFTFQVLLRACSKIESIEGGHHIYMEVIKESRDQELLVINSLVDMYAKCGSLAQARAVFDSFLHRDVASWTVMIGGYRVDECNDEVFQCWEQMQLEGVSPNAVTYASVLSSCGNMESLDRGWEIHAAAVKDGFEQDSFIGNTLIDMYGKHFHLLEAREVFDELIIKDVVSWTALITTHAKHGFLKEALGCMEQMQGDGITPNVVSWNTIISELAEHGLGEEALQSLENMQQQNISPDAITLTSATKACSKLRAITSGHMVHSEILKRGYEKDPVVGNALVDMYGKCGFLEEAQGMFDEMQIKDIISWTSLISGYAEHGIREEVSNRLSEMQQQGVPLTNITCNAVIAAFIEVGLGDEALTCFSMMQFKGVPPDDTTYACILKACSRILEIHFGRRIHSEVVKSGLEDDLFIASTLIEMYGRCGMVMEAEESFSRLPFRDGVLWSILITVYADYGLADKVVKGLQQMQLDHIGFSTPTAVQCLKACNGIGSLPIGKNIHVQIVKQGLEGDTSVSNALICMYGNQFTFVDANYVMDKLCARNTASWNALIAAYTERGIVSEVIRCLRQMKLDGVTPDHVTHMWSLKCASGIGMISWGQELHFEILNAGLEREPSLGNSLVEWYAYKGAYREAHKVLDVMVVGEDNAWKSLCAGYLHNNLCKEAMNCLEEMRQKGSSPTVEMFVCCLKSCGIIRSIAKGHELHSTILKLGIERDSFIGNTTLDMYAKCGSLQEAYAVFEKLAYQNVVSWNALMQGYAENCCSEGVLACWKDMQVEGVNGDGNTVVSVLKACGNLGLAIKGQEIHMEVAKNGRHITERAVSSAVIDMYAKCGLLKEADEIFKRVLDRDVVSLTALIMGYACQGNVEKVFQFVDEMAIMDIRADFVTFLSVLTACCHGGLVDRGREYFNNVSGSDKAILAPEHYNCLVDIIARAGQLDKAVATLENIPVQPKLMMWNTLLGACRKWGNPDLGKCAFICANELTDKQMTPIIPISNIYEDSCDFNATSCRLN